MPLNRDRVGHRYPSYRYEVSREKVREYVLATGHGEAYLAEEGPLTAPPLFAACITGTRVAAVMADPDLGAHWNLVHGAQRYVHRRPVHVGDVLRCTPSIGAIDDLGRFERMVIRVECHDAAEAADAEPVLVSEATILFFKPKEADA